MLSNNNNSNNHVHKVGDNVWVLQGKTNYMARYLGRRDEEAEVRYADAGSTAFVPASSVTPKTKADAFAVRLLLEELQLPPSLLPILLTIRINFQRLLLLLPFLILVLLQFQQQIQLLLLLLFLLLHILLPLRSPPLPLRVLLPI